VHSIELSSSFYDRDVHPGTSLGLVPDWLWDSPAHNSPYSNSNSCLGSGSAIKIICGQKLPYQPNPISRQSKGFLSVPWEERTAAGNL